MSDFDSDLDVFYKPRLRPRSQRESQVRRSCRNKEEKGEQDGRRIDTNRTRQENLNQYTHRSKRKNWFQGVSDSESDSNSRRTATQKRWRLHSDSDVELIRKSTRIISEPLETIIPQTQLPEEQIEPIPTNQDSEADLHLKKIIGSEESLTDLDLTEAPSSSSTSLESDSNDSGEPTTVVVGGKSLRGTRARKRTSDLDTEDDRRNRTLRSKQPVNYSKQLMPANFTQILDKEFREFENNSKTDSPRRKDRNHKPSKNRLNESDDESHPTIFKNRICALLTKTNGKNTIVPQNMVEMMRAEEARLLSHVDENVKMKFMEKKQAVEAGNKVEISFDHVAGFDDHIMSLKEMIGLPLMYPDVFSQFQISPPKGVLFHGPPGTGADVLNKWVGESEKQLRLLFEQAKAWQPSIIFFDEIDGLAPVRSSKQDQIHASIVSTLLALMDGLDDRGQVVVIGATNRIDSIDPALRRPGRFDREFFFGLPKQDARKKIIQQATKNWSPVIPENEIEKLACMTHGYNGADVKALCTEAALTAVRRSFPEIYQSNVTYDISVESIQVTVKDFIDSISKMMPSTERSSQNVGKPIPQHLRLLLEKSFEELSKWISRIVPLIEYAKRSRPSSELIDQTLNTTTSLSINDYLKPFSPRLLIFGPEGMGAETIGSALVSLFEQRKFYVRTLDIHSILSDDQSPESTIQIYFHELKRHHKAAMYLPNIHVWWDTVNQSTKNALLHQLENCKLISVAVLITIECEYDEIPIEITSLFPNIGTVTTASFPLWRYSYRLDCPSKECRLKYFSQVVSDFDSDIADHSAGTPNAPIDRQLSIRSISPISNVLGSKELKEVSLEFESHQLQFRRVFMSILDELRKSFRMFTKHFDIDGDVMDFSIIELKLNQNEYSSPDDFMEDVRLILTNALILNDSGLISKARKMVDLALEHTQSLTTEFIDQCWYFYLFKNSQLKKKDDGFVDDAVELSDDDTNSTSGMPTQYPQMTLNPITSKPFELQSIEEVLEYDDPSSPNHDQDIIISSEVLRQLDEIQEATPNLKLQADEKTQLIRFMVRISEGWSIERIEEFVVSIAGHILENNGQILLNQIYREFNG